MGLTVGSGPLGEAPAGSFNFEVDAPHGRALFWERYPRKVRAVVGGETVAESTRAQLLLETGLHGVWYFPEEDVRLDLLERTELSTTCPVKGEARYWTIRAGGRVVENAAWAYPDPIAGAPPLAGHVAFYFDRIDEWWEEDERVYVHVRDPYHRVDALRSSRRVRVSLGGVELADSSRPVAVFETGLPPRWYLPREDVRMELLRPEEGKTTECPYKGTATYWSAEGEEGRMIAWCYEDPRHPVEAIRGRLCFFDERADVELDGEPQERPRTQWSSLRSDE